MARLHLTLLGGFQLRVDQRTIPVTARKAQALLAYLALRADRPHSRETLVGLLRGDAREERARHNLRQTMFRLRQAFARARNAGLVARGDTIALDTAAVSVDALEFQRLLGTGTVPGLEAALALYRGPLLEGMHVAEASFEEWLQPERERLRDGAVQALAKLLDHQTKRGAVEAAVQTATWLLALDPVEEGTHRALMRLYVQQGRRARALRQYQVCVGVLQRELGVEPEPETRQAYQEILQDKDGPIVTPDPPVGARPGPRRAPSHVARAVPSLEPPVVGRQSELARLHQALEAAWHHGGRTVVVLGEAGIGKTRLLEELAGAALQRGGRLLSSRCYETEQILAFGPWVEALGAGLEGLGRDVLGRLDPISRADLARLLPELAEPERDPPGSADDYLRLFGAVARVIEVLAALSPLVLILEDLHWADEMSVRLFGFLTRRIEASPVLLLASVRKEDLSEAPLLRRLLEELRGPTKSEFLTLPPLSEAEIHSLVHVLARTGTHETVLAGLAKQVWALSEGNPFVAVETMRALREGHQFETSMIALPERVREAIGGRLERLGARAGELLAAAAVIGREFEFAMLQNATGLDERATAEGVEELVRRGVLHGVGPRLDFVHDRVREVAYGQLLSARRKRLHVSVAEAIEAVYADDLNAHHVALGIHYCQGEAWTKAVTHLRRAGAQALTRSGHREAAACFAQALDALSRLPHTADSAALAIDLRFDLRVALFPLGEVEAGMRCLNEAEQLARELDDQRRLAMAYTYLCSHRWIAGQPGEARALGERARPIADTLGDFALGIAARYYLGLVYHTTSDYARGDEVALDTIRRLQGDLVRERFGVTSFPAVTARARLGWSLAERGRFADGVTSGREAIDLAEGLGDAYSLVWAYWGLANVYLIRGDLELAAPLLERSRALARERELTVLLPLVNWTSGYLDALAGRYGDAIRSLDESLDALEGRSWANYHSAIVIHLGEACLLGGEVARARVLAARGLALVRDRSERGWEAWGLRLCAEIAAHPSIDDAEAARLRYEEALDLSGQLGMRPLAAHCHNGLGKL